MRRYFTSTHTHFRQFWKNRWATLFLVLSLVLNAVIWLAIQRYGKSEEDFVPLHYNTTLGIDRIGQWTDLFIMPAIGAGIILIHFLLSVFFRRERFLPEMLMSGALLLQLLLAISTVFLLYNFF